MSDPTPEVPEPAASRRAFLALLATTGAAWITVPLARAVAAAAPRHRPLATPAVRGAATPKQFLEDRKGVRKLVDAIRTADLPPAAGTGWISDVHRLPGSGRRE